MTDEHAGCLMKSLTTIEAIQFFESNQDLPKVPRAKPKKRLTGGQSSTQTTILSSQSQPLFNDSSDSEL